MFKKLFRIYGTASTTFIVVIGTLTFGVAIYFIYLKTPSFWWKLEDDITSNKALMNEVGGLKEIQFKYADSLDADNPFRITVVGECDSALIVMRGFYTKDRYTLSDTIIRKCK